MPYWCSVDTKTKRSDTGKPDGVLLSLSKEFFLVEQVQRVLKLIQSLPFCPLEVAQCLRECS